MQAGTQPRARELLAGVSGLLAASTIIIVAAVGAVHSAAVITDHSFDTRDYYVSTAGSDANGGSAEHPWASIQHASSLAQPGWTVHVSPGTYDVAGPGAYALST